MARPRKPSNVLELRGAFKKHPERRRKDQPGSGPFNPTPPPHLAPELGNAWRAVVERVPSGTLTRSDELTVEIAATLLALWWQGRDLDTLKELRQWFAKLGLSPVDRARLPAPPNTPPGNPFGAL